MLEAPIKHGKLLTVIILILMVLGLAAAQRIPVQMIPDLDVRSIRVITSWAGATPQDIEKEILIEQERYLRSVPNLTRMESRAETGQARITLEFPFGVNIEETLIKVSNALSRVSNYPENVDQPRLFSSSFSENAFLYFAITPLANNPLNIDMDMVNDFISNEVQPRLERVQGVSEVSLRGGAQRQVQIIVDPAKLALRGLSLTDVRSAIRERNRDVSAGDINEGKRRFLLRTIGRFDSVEQFENLIISRQNSADILLKDIADVVLDHYEVRNIGIVNNEPALTFAVYREPGSNVIDIKNMMLDEVKKVEKEILNPNGLQVSLIGDDVRYVQASVDKVTENLALGGLLATLILFVFLRSGRATLIGLMGMPVCTLAVFIGLLVFDRTINVISLAGIAFAIGMTVDNTIVVLESIEQARRKGLSKLQSAIVGVKEVWPAVLASSLTTVLVFAPVLFVEEEAGQLYSDIAIAISTAIIASMFFAVAVVPAASASFGFGSAQINNTSKSSLLLRLVEWLDGGQIRRTFSMLIIFVSTFGIAWYTLPAAEYLPEGEEPKAFSRMVAPPGYNLAEMEKIGQEIKQHLKASLHADPELYDQGELTLPALKYYFLRMEPGMLWVLSEPVRHDDLEPMMDTFKTLFKSYPGMRGSSHRGSIISSNQSGSRAVNIDISGSEQAALYATAQRVYDRAEALFEDPQIRSWPSTFSLDQPLVKIQPRWQRLSELGISPQAFAYDISALSDGAYVDEFILNDRKVDIFLFSQQVQQQSLIELANMPITTPNGSVLPLNALADLVETVDSDQLRRIDGQRTVTLAITPPREIALETAVEKVRNELLPELRAAGEVEKGVFLSISGATDQLDATRQSLSDNFTIAVVLIYLLLVAIFTHWGYPLLIMTTIPLGIAGGLVGLVAVNASGPYLSLVGITPIIQPFDMITMLGFIILLGTVVNNPILIVEEARKNLLDTSIAISDAVNQAVATRLRPILMSSATTIFGLAPLVFIPGAGSELYRGIGIVVLSGILFSTIVTLFFLPSLMITTLKLNNLLTNRNKKAR
jgi:multidrug efflux pump subunit AcrB